MISLEVVQGWAIVWFVFRVYNNFSFSVFGDEMTCYRKGLVMDSIFDYR